MDFLLDDLDDDPTPLEPKEVAPTALLRAVGTAAPPPTLVPMNATIPLDGDDDGKDDVVSEEEDDEKATRSSKRMQKQSNTTNRKRVVEEEEVNPLAMSDHEDEELEEDRQDADDWSSEDDEFGVGEAKMHLGAANHRKSPEKGKKPKMSRVDAAAKMGERRDTPPGAEEEGEEMTLETVQGLMDAANRMLKEFDEIAPMVGPHPWVFLPPPSSSSRYKIAGMNKVRHRILAEQALLTSALRDQAYRRATCSNGATIRVTLGLISTEPAIMQMSYPVVVPPVEDPLLTAANQQVPTPTTTTKRHQMQPATAQRKHNRNAMQQGTSVDVDMVTRGGLRWIKVKGMSARNFEYEVVGGRERRSASASLSASRCLTDSLRDVCNAANSDRYRLPFGKRPHIVIICAEQPTETTLKVLADECPEVTCCSWDVYQRIREIESPELLKTTMDTINKEKEITTTTPFALVNFTRFADTARLPIQIINFDVTALVALCCDMCHGFSGQPYPVNPVLDRQSKDEACGKPASRAVEDFLEPTLKELTFFDDTPTEAKKDPSSASAPQHVDPTSLEKTENEKADKKEDASSEYPIPVSATSSLGLTLRSFRAGEVEDASSIQKALEATGAFRASKEFLASLVGADIMDEPSEISMADGEPGLKPICPTFMNTDGNAKRMPSNWIVSYQGVEEFRWILQTVAGKDELRRARWLFERTWVVGAPPPAYEEAVGATSAGSGSTTRSPVSPLTEQLDRRKPHISDANGALQSECVGRLKDTGHIQGRHKAVFGVADSPIVKGVTLTANRAFVQAAHEQGVTLCIAFHPARALTEKKRLGTDAPDHEKVKRKR